MTHLIKATDIKSNAKCEWFKVEMKQMEIERRLEQLRREEKLRYLDYHEA